MIVSAVPEADPPYALVEGIQSSRALSTFTRAVTHWYAFGRHDYVMVDMDTFGDWSPRVVDELAVAIGAATDAGHWLAFFPVAAHWVDGTGDGRFHCFPDRAQAQQAMRHHWSTKARVSMTRRLVALTLGSLRGTAPPSGARTCSTPPTRPVHRRPPLRAMSGRLSGHAWFL